jgi:transportin-1
MADLDEPDMDFAIVSLDLLSGVAQGLGAEVAPLVASSDPPVMQMLLVCMKVTDRCIGISIVKT